MQTAEDSQILQTILRDPQTGLPQLLERYGGLLHGVVRHILPDERDVEELLEACEYAANLLEAGELVPMAYPPTAKIEAYRRQKHVDAMEIADYLTELIGTLKKACHII